ncbi:MAG: hypothetical protein Q8K70_05220 [Bacteroidota bacterium]|nr:hypothetical protein [Bacteroidota bacterium]
MKKVNIKNIAWALLPALIIGFTACGDKDETTPTTTPTPTKTLNKTSLTNNKKWYNQGSTIQHDFKPDGKYFSGGTWRWINNTDTMETIGSLGGTPLKWRFEWNSETELECERISGTGQGSGLFLMKTTEWQ